MLRTCRAPGCHEAVQGFSHYCDNHKKTTRRHGAPTQQGVTVHKLRPYEALVDARRARNPNSEAWGILTARWEVVLDHAKAELQRFAEGRPAVRHERLAAHHLVTIGRDVEPWAVVRTSIAMYLMLDQRPTRFVTDDAFVYQLVRRVRGLADCSAGSFWDAKEQRSKKVYRDISPRVTQWMAALLKAAFGAPGLKLAAKEREDASKAREERRRLSDALENLE